MKRLWSNDDLLAHWSLQPSELALVEHKEGANRLGFALLLKYFQIDGRFPRQKHDVPVPAIAFVATRSWKIALGTTIGFFLIGYFGMWEDTMKTVSMIVRLHYADDTVEDHPIRNGVELADYIRVVDVPGSKLAFRLRGGQQVRYFAIHPKKSAAIDRIELVKGNDATAPVVMAVTVESPDGGH